MKSRRHWLAYALVLFACLSVLLGMWTLARPRAAGDPECRWALESERVVAQSREWPGQIAVAIGPDDQSMLLVINAEDSGRVLEVHLTDGRPEEVEPAAASEFLAASGVLGTSGNWITVSHRLGACEVSRWNADFGRLERTLVAGAGDNCDASRLTSSDAAILYWSNVSGERRFTTVLLSLPSGEVGSPVLLPPTHELRAPALTILDGTLVASWCGPDSSVRGFDSVDAAPNILWGLPSSGGPCSVALMSGTGGGAALGIFVHDRHTFFGEVSREGDGLSGRYLDDLDLSHGLQLPPDGGRVVNGWLIAESDGTVIHVDRRPALARMAGRSRMEVTAVAAQVHAPMTHLTIAPLGSSAVQVWRTPATDEIRFRRLVCR